MFKSATPESIGISSENVLSFIQTLDSYSLVNHSIIMAKGNKIFAECYYKPFDKDFGHRMYSVSKSFVSIAVGLAMTEGLISLEDKIIDYFPEYRNEKTDALYEETTIRNMLSMQSNVNTYEPWWGIYNDRVESYYQNKSNQLPGTLFHYDSVGSYLLGCIVEKVTGMTFLEYLKDRVLLEMGFSKESYTLYSPGGYTLGDSGVICTARDLLIFARLIMNKGEYNGKQYIDRQYMTDAVSKLVDSNNDGDIGGYNTYGYGYLIWKAPDDGFALLGMGTQFAVCDPKHDFIFVINSDNQVNPKTAATIIYHELYKTVIHNIGDAPIEENAESYAKLGKYIENCSLVCIKGKIDTLWTGRIDGVKYKLSDNPMNISYFKISFSDAGGIFEFEKDNSLHKLGFSLNENLITKFPGKLRNSDTAGVMCNGHYDCACSAAWTEESKFVIKSHIIDTYMGCLNVYLSFKDDRVTMKMLKTGQYVLDGFNGFATGRIDEQ